ncbi:ATP synthase subunit b [Dissulfurispira thermophila]|uniref:ATP synthase subunit b n=2 Tax=root TaxID=1 RepID=A0A7G1H2C4_9BACT|nr:ATP synthase F0 subunit B [Dissulfurispira thermophila]BCB96955.1 ATP synthase subunit b [Dissulfurispira thermophila]
MLEFNQWFFVLLANFLILLFVLNAILFKPLAKIFKERETATAGALDEAKSLMLKKDEAVERMNAELMSAKNKAREIFDSLREAGIARQKEMLTKAEAEAVELIEKARKELQTEAEKARAALRADIEKFSDEIVSRLVRV